MIKSKPAKEARTKRRITRVDVERMLILCASALGVAVPSAAGFLAGMFFLRATDALLARVQGRTLNGTEKMLLAVTLHNLPEGMAVGAALLLLAAGVFLPLLPWMLAFAAGAMLCVIVEELIPESARDSGHSTAWFALGFTVMMLLDVWLG